MSGRNTHRHHRRRHWAEYDSSLCAAFLRALMRWISAHANDPTAQVVLPTGRVGVEELTNVLRGLERARQATAHDGFLVQKEHDE
jgi:hypothetical protein